MIWLDLRIPHAYEFGVGGCLISVEQWLLLVRVRVLLW